MPIFSSHLAVSLNQMTTFQNSKFKNLYISSFFMIDLFYTSNLAQCSFSATALDFMSSV